MSDSQRSRRTHRIILSLLMGFIIYWVSMGPLLFWEQHAETKKQFRARSRFRAGVSAPLRWIQRIDPTGVLPSFHASYMGLWVDPNFAVPQQ